MLLGGCLCGSIRYESGAPITCETLCHCSTCRRAQAAPFVAWFTVPAAEFRLIGGEPARYASTQRATRSFCPRCGTPLTFQHADTPEEIDVTTCSLDDAERVPPRDHTFARSRLSWVTLDDGLPRFAQSRTGEK